MPILSKLPDTMQNRLSAMAALEKDRLFYWLPVLWGLGIGFYFQLDGEPSFALSFLLLMVMSSAALALRRRFGLARLAYYAALSCAMIALGFFLIQCRSLYIGTAILAEEMRPVMVQAAVRGIERAEDGGRLTLVDIEWPEYLEKDAAGLPQKIRIRSNRDIDHLRPGQTVKALLKLGPPPQPAMPGGYDFARHLYFLGIGAVGFVLGDIHVIEDNPADSLRLRLSSLRDAIIVKVYDVLDKDEASISAALITSEQSGLSDEARDIMRRTGLQHILSVSGLHLTLAAGIIFLALRLILIWIPAFHMRAKKIAACGAIAGAFFYLVISGFEIPTQRAFVMVALVFLGVLLDREAISLRLVALAACIVLLFQPESLLNPSFQMSFAAVTALVAVYEGFKPRFAGIEWNAGRVLLLYFFGSAFTSMIASAATAPFVAYHFHQATLQGVVANMLVAPVVSFWLMPFVIISLIAMAFGAEYWPLFALGEGVGVMMDIARWVGSFSGGVYKIPAGSPQAIFIMALGGLWLLLWKSGLRWFGILGVFAGIGLWAAVPLPDVLIRGAGDLYGVRGADGRLGVSSLRREKFTADVWRGFFGQEDVLEWTDPALWDRRGERHFFCDTLGCRYTVGDAQISFVFSREAFAEDCKSADVVITALKPPQYCAAQSRVLDLYFQKDNAYAIRIKGKEIEIQSTKAERGQRPWSAKSASTAHFTGYDDK